MSSQADYRRCVILSHKHKFLFVKGRKVGGTSAEIALSQLCGPKDIITPIVPIDERYRHGTAGEPRNYVRHVFPPVIRHLLERRFNRQIGEVSVEKLTTIRSPPGRYSNHMRLSKVLRHVPAADDYEILAVERSPYAKILSLANWVGRHAAYKKGGELAQLPANIGQTIDRMIADDSINAASNLELYRDLEGQVRVRPWRTEHLAEDFAAFLARRGLPDIPLVHAKKGFNSERADPAKLLRADQIKEINRRFAEEFETFGWPMLG